MDLPLASVPGTLFLVVGPSGAGKDSLLRSAQARLDGHPDYYFPRRAITRPADPGSEDFDSVTPKEFKRRANAGAFCLQWQAHGLSYGVPSSVRSAVMKGRHAVVNVSRTVIVPAAAWFPTVHVLHVTAPAEVLRQRLLARGRESDGDIDARRSRRVDLPDVPGVVVSTIVNDATLEAATAAFLAAVVRGGVPLAELASAPPAKRGLRV